MKAASSQVHQQFQELLARGEWEQAEALWLELARDLPAAAGNLLLLVQEFARAGRTETAATLAGMLAPVLKEAGRYHEWLFALKLQAAASTPPKQLRAELSEAYRQVFADDTRLPTILRVAGLDDPQTALPVVIHRVDTLLALPVGSFCRHKSWGFGRVSEFDATLERLLVDFPNKPGHAMQLAYAAESLTPISPDHLEARKVTDLAGLQRLAQEDPVGLVRLALVSFDRAVPLTRLEAALAGSVVPADQWKKWWDNTKKLLKRDPHFVLPTRKTDPIQLRTVPVAQQDELLMRFQQAATLAQKTAVTRQFLKICDEIPQAELLFEEFYDGLRVALDSARGVKAAERLEAAFAIDELRAHMPGYGAEGTSLAAELLASVTDLPALLTELSSATQKRAVALLKRFWPERLTAVVNQLPTRVLDEMVELLPTVAETIVQHVAQHTASTELLAWLCKSWIGPTPPTWLERLPGHVLLGAVLARIEDAANRAESKRLSDLLLSEETLLTELLAQAPSDVIRDMARRLLSMSAFNELDRRLLMARLLKEFDFIQDLLLSRTEKPQPLLVSWPSYERRRAELEEIVQKKLPQIAREIAQARSYGDLRENFEYKAAKHQQRLLLRRRSELERLLAQAQPTDFADARTDSVQIGTAVTLTDLDSQQTLTYYILGAWDGDPERHILSYPAALAQALLNKKIGDVITWSGETGPQRLRVERIEKLPADLLQSLAATPHGDEAVKPASDRN